MAVFTTVTDDALATWISKYPLGTLVSNQGIIAGVTNTNYLVTTTTGKYVLTLFETLRASELPYYVQLLIHLAECGMPVSHPIAHHGGEYIDRLAGKPTLLMNYLPGAVNENPSIDACFNIGSALAQLHQHGQTFTQYAANPRGRQWREDIASKIYPLLSLDEATLLHHEISTLRQLDQYTLPQGLIHADLFRDNVLMDGDTITGLIDFYYACNDTLLFDVAVTLNDWSLDDGYDIDDAKASALLRGYQQHRRLTPAETQVWPLLLRAAAIRFWLSRLYDLHYPVPGALTQSKDPDHFKHLLLSHLARQHYWLTD